MAAKKAGLTGGADDAVAQAGVLIGCDMSLTREWVPMSMNAGLAVARGVLCALLAFAITLGLARAQTPEAQSDPAKDPAKTMIGAWEISNSARDKTCPVNFKAEAVTGGFVLEFDPPCVVFPSLKDVGVWAMGPNDAVRLLDSKGVIVLDFTEVENGMYEAERKGVGLFFMRTQAAIKAATVSAEQLFGEWTMLQEAEKPLCKVTLSNAAAADDAYKLVVKPGCDAAIAGLGLATWRLDVSDLLLEGPGGAWRFSESDATVWERIPASTDPMLMMRDQKAP